MGEALLGLGCLLIAYALPPEFIPRWAAALVGLVLIVIGIVTLTTGDREQDAPRTGPIQLVEPAHWATNGESRRAAIEAAIREVDERPTHPKARANWRREWREVREYLIVTGKPIRYRLTGFDPVHHSDKVADVLHKDATEWIDQYWEARKAWWITPMGGAERLANAFSAGPAPGPDWRRALLGQVDAGLTWLERHPG